MQRFYKIIGPLELEVSHQAWSSLVTYSFRTKKKLLRDSKPLEIKTYLGKVSVSNAKEKQKY